MRGYWAATEAKELAGHVWTRWREYVAILQASGRLRVLQDSHAMRMNWGRVGNAMWTRYRIGRTDGGARLSVRVNDYRSIGDMIVQIVTAQLPVGEAKAATTTQSALGATQLAGAILDYHRRQGFETLLRDGASKAVFLAEAWFLGEWDALAGKPIPVEERTPEELAEDEVMGEGPDGPAVTDVKARFEGEPVFELFTMVDVARDPGAKHPAQSAWYVIRRWVNKWEVAGRYIRDDAKQEAILSSSPWQDTSTIRLDPMTNSRGTMGGAFDDVIPVYLFLHRRNTAMPQGRRALVLGSGMTLEDGDLPPSYGDFPLYLLMAAHEEDAAFGTTPVWDLQGPQDAANMALSGGVTKSRQNTAKALVHAASGVDAAALASESPVLKWAGEAYQKPEIFQGKLTPEQDIALVGALSGMMERISGVNSVARGNVDALGKDASGSLAAFVQAQALAANSGLQASFYSWLAVVYTSVVYLYHTYGPTGRQRRLVALAGKSPVALVRDFQGAELDGFEAIHVEPANPLTVTTQGRLATLNVLAEMGQPIGPQKVLEFLTTGQWKVTWEDAAQEQSALNEMVQALREGRPTPVMPYDNHPKWIAAIQHGVLNSREARMAREIWHLALQQIYRHIDAWNQADPQVLMVLGIPPPPALAMGLPMEGALPPGAEAPPEQPASPGAPGGTPEAPEPPKMPINPETGERAEPIAGPPV